MWKLKGCPRCGGDVFVDCDPYGRCEHCLQCGYHSDLQSIVEVRERVGKGNLELAGGKHPNQIIKQK